MTFCHLQEIINHLRQHSHCTTYGSGMSAPVVMQILTSFKILMGEDGTNEGTGRSHIVCVCLFWYEEVLNVIFIWNQIVGSCMAAQTNYGLVFGFLCFSIDHMFIVAIKIICPKAFTFMWSWKGNHLVDHVWRFQAFFFFPGKRRVTQLADNAR